MVHIAESDWVSVGIYLFMSWLAAFGIFEIVRTLPAGAMAWLLAGGAFYTAGAFIFAGRKFDFRPGVFGHHEIWHLCVVAAAICHYILIWEYVV
jgi:hemolysin III